MTFQKNILTRAILATGLVAGLGLSQMALAETENTDLNITAGISAAMTLVCGSDLNFGITRVTDTTFTQTTLTLETNNSITKSGDEKVVPAAGTAGLCTLSGSLANNVTPSVTFNGTSTLEGNINAFTALNAASGNNLTVDTFTTDVAGRKISDGEIVIKIGANLVIPADAAIGGYSGTIEVTVNDAPGT